MTVGGGGGVTGITLTSMGEGYSGTGYLAPSTTSSIGNVTVQRAGGDNSQELSELLASVCNLFKQSDRGS